jgi:7-carboxy-7-deazaguanine synthase
MSRAKIMEIFQSIQGEGKYVGVQQVFVRFFECNIHCVWCDTPHSIGDTSRRFTEMESDVLFTRIQDLWPGSHSVSITGGEPLVQVDFLRDFLPRLRRAGMSVYLETNGILPSAFALVVDDVDIVSMDLKLPSSTGCQPYWAEHREFLEIAKQKDIFVKVVVSLQTMAEDIDQAVELVRSTVPGAVFILQPNFFDSRADGMRLCLEYHRRCSAMLHDVRIIPQVHKMLKIR